MADTREVQAPAFAAVLGKKGKFVADYQRIDGKPEWVNGALDFLSRVSMGDETMHKLPQSIMPAPAA